MKKILSLILVMMMFAFNAIAEESKTSKSSQSIMLEIAQYNDNESFGRFRAPMRIGIEAWYNAESNSIDILYDGEADGGVFIYFNDTIIEYDSKINTTLHIPSLSGLFTIEIVSEHWVAKGYLQL